MEAVITASATLFYQLHHTGKTIRLRVSVFSCVGQRYCQHLPHRCKLKMLLNVILRTGIGRSDSLSRWRPFLSDTMLRHTPVPFFYCPFWKIHLHKAIASLFACSYVLYVKTNKQNSSHFPSLLCKLCTKYHLTFKSTATQCLHFLYSWIIFHFTHITQSMCPTLYLWTSY